MNEKTSRAKSPITLQRVLTTAAVLLLFALVFVAPAAADPVTTEDSLKTALSTGGTVTLGANIALTQGITIDKETTVTLDLAGYTLSHSSTETNPSFVIKNKGTLTIMDSSAATGTGTGKITSAATNPDGQLIPKYASNTISNCGFLTLENGTIENQATEGAACYAIDVDTTLGDATLTINGGKVVSSVDAIRMQGKSTNTNTVVTINDGEIQGNDCAIWIHLTGSDNSVSPIVNLNINGGTLSAERTIYSSSFGYSYDKVTINIIDGTIIGALIVGGDSSSYVSSQRGSGDEKVTISGGTIQGTITSQSTTNNIDISGGEFTTEPDVNYLAAGSNILKVNEQWIVGSSISDLTPQTVTYTGTAASAFSGYEAIYSQNGIVKEPVNVGTYNVTVYHVATDSTDKYYVDTLENGLVIEPATLTATYAGETISYGEKPKLEVIPTGFVNGETAATAAGYVAPTLTNTNTAVGSYTLKPSGGSADNYKFVEYVSGVLKIEETAGEIEPEVPGTIDNVNGNTATITPPSTTGGESVITTSTDGKTTTIDAGSGVTITLTSANAVTPEADGSVTGTFNTVEAIYNEIPADLKDSQTPVSYGLIIPMIPDKALAAGIPLPTIDATFKTDVASKVAGHEGSSYNSLAMIQATYSAGDIDIINNNLSGEVTVTFTLPASVGQKLVVFHVPDNNGVPVLLAKGKVTITTNAAGNIVVTAKGTGFSSYVVAQDTTPAPQSSSTPQGSSVWLTESQTPTQTPSEQPTEKPTDVAPTNVPTTQPTPTQTESPGFGVLAVLAGLGAVAVLRRK